MISGMFLISSIQQLLLQWVSQNRWLKIVNLPLPVSQFSNTEEEVMGSMHQMLQTPFSSRRELETNPCQLFNLSQMERMPVPKGIKWTFWHPLPRNLVFHLRGLRCRYRTSERRCSAPSTSSTITLKTMECRQLFRMKDSIISPLSKTTTKHGSHRSVRRRSSTNTLLSVMHLIQPMQTQHCKPMGLLLGRFLLVSQVKLNNSSRPFSRGPLLEWITIDSFTCRRHINSSSLCNRHHLLSALLSPPLAIFTI